MLPLEKADRNPGQSQVSPWEKQIGGGKVIPCHRSPGREDRVGTGKWMLSWGKGAMAEKPKAKDEARATLSI